MGKLLLLMSLRVCVDLKVSPSPSVLRELFVLHQANLTLGGFGVVRAQLGYLMCCAVGICFLLIILIFSNSECIF